ncbi:MAG: DNA polymerase IV [Gammaproteobacteria bacterium]|nr:DNA polymerase IV [Gammaproteobacteria bacterium]
MVAPRRVAHLDMDAFYASVELLRYPELAGLPLVIGGRRRRPAGEPGVSVAHQRLKEYVGRGVVTTATYAARPFGVHSGLGLMKAARLCPEAILLPADFDEYRRCSRAFKEVITGITPVMEDRGIDEVYIEFSGAPGVAADGGRALAQCLQEAIQARTGLGCSIGVAPNKLLAKLASELHKPRGITILFESDLAAQIWPLPCRRLNGIGPKAEARLAALDIHTIGELARCERAWLREHFGSGYGEWLYASAWGRDERAVHTRSEPVSMSRETTFERDLHAVHDRSELGELFTRLCRDVAADLQRKGYVGRTIGIKLRYDDFSSLTRDQTLDLYTADAALIRRAAGLCLKRAPLGRRLRLLGVRVGGLVRREAAPARSMAMFPDA